VDGEDALHLPNNCFLRAHQQYIDAAIHKSKAMEDNFLGANFVTATSGVDVVHH
jgi:hypothetical protein